MHLGVAQQLGRPRGREGVNAHEGRLELPYEAADLVARPVVGRYPAVRGSDESEQPRGYPRRRGLRLSGSDGRSSAREAVRPQARARLRCSGCAGVRRKAEARPEG